MASLPMMARRQRVDRGRKPFHSRLQLKRQILRVMARLMQVAALEPETRLLRRLPHIAQLALPGTWILGGVGAEAPALADPIRDLWADQLGGPAVHRAVAG